MLTEGKKKKKKNQALFLKKNNLLKTEYIEQVSFIALAEEEKNKTKTSR